MQGLTRRLSAPTVTEKMSCPALMEKLAVPALLERLSKLEVREALQPDGEGRKLLREYLES